VHWAEFALGPDAQCEARTTRTARARPMAHGHTARPALGLDAQCGARLTRHGVRRTARVRVHAVALPSGARSTARYPSSRRRLGTGAWETAGQRLTGVETAARQRRATWPAAVRATRLGQRRSGRWLSGRGDWGTGGRDEAHGRDASCWNAA
jgi:hypothetical protein